MNIRLGVYVLFICAFASVLFVLSTQFITMRRENAELSQKCAALTKENEVLKLNDLRASPPGQSSAGTSAELLRLRNEVNMLRQKASVLPSSPPPGTRVAVEPAQQVSAPIPAESLSYAGYATPEAGLQTAIWAMRTCNLEQYLACFAPEDRAMVAERFEEKSMAEVQKTLIGQIASVRALRLDKKRIMDDGTVGFPVSSTEVDDGLTVTKAEKVLRFKNVGGEWKLVL